MPGIIGFINTDDRSQPNLLQNMATALEPEDRFRVDLHQNGHLGLGRVSLGIANTGPQPFWSEDGSLGVVLAGELFDTGAQKEVLRNKGYQFRRDDDAELILHLYREHGADFPGRVNGIFVAALWDRQAQTLVIANDRLGLHPLYHTQANGRFLFASGVRALLADPAVARTVDPVAVGQFLTFDHLIGDRTLLQEVKLLRGGSVLTVQDGRLRIRSYWDPRYPDRYRLCSEEAWLDGLMYHLQRAMARQKPDGSTPAGMLLSGGLDSRALLALLRDDYSGPFHTFTWGIPGCDDARFAKEVAAKLNTQHHFYPLPPDWLLEHAQACVHATDGMGNLVNLHARATLEQETQHAQIMYKGFLGDAMLGFAQRHQHWATYDPATAIEAHLQVHREQGVITFEPREHHNTFTDTFQQALGSAVMDSYREGMAESGSSSLADQRLYYDFRQRVPRHTLNGVKAVRSHAVVRLPFADNDLVDWSLQIPPGLRYKRRLMFDGFIRAYPDLAKIPLANTGLPMIECSRDILLRAQRFARWHLQQAGLNVAYPGRKPYKDYGTWFRTVLREWVEDTLLDKQALERGYLRPEVQGRLVAEHMAGDDHTMKLGALLTLETWHRQFID